MNLQQRNMITSEKIYLDLCDKIENLKYMPGDAISENELCEVYSTSRHMIRGAFTMLKQRRLLEVYPQRGSFVSLIDMNYISDILFLRESIEQEALLRVLESGDVTAVCEKMEANLEHQRKDVDEKIPGEQFFRLDNEFHHYILEAAGQGGIMDMLSDSYIHVRRWRNFEVYSQMRVKGLIKEHEAILDALKTKNRSAVRAAMHYHLDTIARYGAVCESQENQYFYKR